MRVTFEYYFCMKPGDGVDERLRLRRGYYMFSVI